MLISHSKLDLGSGDWRVTVAPALNSQLWEMACHRDAGFCSEVCYNVQLAALMCQSQVSEKSSQLPAKSGSILEL